MKQLVKILVVVFSIIQSQWAVQVELSRGWNLFGPLISSSTDPVEYFSALGVNMSAQSADVIRIWGYSPGIGWSSFEPGQSGSFALEPGKGYWIQMENAKTVTLPDSFGSFSVSLSGAGWHLVGLNSSVDVEVSSEGLLQPGNFTEGGSADIQRIWSFVENIWRTYPQSESALLLETLPAGKGAWFFIASDFEINSQNIDLSDLFPPTCPGCPSIGN